MTERVDARGLPCPQPVIRTRNAMETAARVVTIVDNDTAEKNVTRMAEKAGAAVEAEHREDGIYLHITVGSTPAEKPGALEQEAYSGGPLVLVVPGPVMGRGDDQELGEVLIRGFFHALGEVEPLPDTIVLFNEGVRLVAEGSPVVADLLALSEEGVEVLACGTCLGHLGLKEAVAVGTVSNMYTIAETLLGAGRLVYV